MFSAYICLNFSNNLDHSKRKSYFFIVCAKNKNKAKHFVTIVRRPWSCGLSVKCRTTGKPFTGGIRGRGNTNTQKGGNGDKSNGASESHCIELNYQTRWKKKQLRGMILIATIRMVFIGQLCYSTMCVLFYLIRCHMKKFRWRWVGYNCDHWFLAKVLKCCLI